MVRHGFLAVTAISLLSACAAVPRAGDLRIEDRPADGVVRVLNASRTEARVFHEDLPGFASVPQMFWIRFRDGAGTPVRIDGTLADGWFTPLVWSSTAFGPGQWPPRRELVIPAEGFLDLPLKLQQIMVWYRDDDLQVDGPCEIQVKFRVFPKRRTWRAIEIVSDWRPAACPVAS